MRELPRGYFQFAGFIPLPSMIALIVPSSNFAPVEQHDDLVSSKSYAHFWWLRRKSAERKPPRRRATMTLVRQTRCPRSPNRYLDQPPRGRRQLNLGGRQVESNGFLDAAPRFLLRLAGRGAPWQLRTDCGVALSCRVILQDHAEPHARRARQIPPGLSLRPPANCRQFQLPGASRRNRLPRGITGWAQGGSVPITPPRPIKSSRYGHSSLCSIPLQSVL